MTDKDKLIDLLDYFGIVYSEDMENTITIESKTGEKNKGYTGFVCDWNFSEDGQFFNVGIWE